MVARIFISHSSKTERAHDYLAALKATFKDAFEDQAKIVAAWVDHADITTTQDWRDEIEKALAEARGAIFLLSQEAVKSNYVQIEAAVLLNRRRVTANFPVVFVLVDVERETLKNGFFGALDVTAQQIIEDAVPARAVRRAINDMAAELDLDRIPPVSETEEWRGGVTDLLRKAGVTEDDVEAICLQSKLDSTLGAFRGGSPANACRWLADALKNATPPTVEAALTMLLRRHPSGADELRKALDHLVPQWVDEVTATSIVKRARGEAEQRQFAIKVAENITLEAFTCRGRGCPLGTAQIPLPIAIPDHREKVLGSPAEKAALIEAQVMAGLDSPDLARLSRTLRGRTDWRLESLNTDSDPVFAALAIDFWPPESELLALLRSRFPTVTFCFKSPDGGTSLVPGLPPVEGLRPDQENILINSYLKTLAKLKSDNRRSPA